MLFNVLIERLWAEFRSDLYDIRTSVESIHDPFGGLEASRNAVFKKWKSVQTFFESICSRN